MTPTDLVRAEFVALDGERRGYLALPGAAGPHKAVLVYQEAFGVNRYVQAECERLARAGYAALAPDLFRGETYSYGDRPKVVEKLKSLSDNYLLGDVRAAIGYLDKLGVVEHGTYGALGFCMGGRLAILTAIELGKKIAAAVSFYGGNIAPQISRFGWPILLERVAEIEGAVLLFYGADDDTIAPDEHARLADALSTAKKRYAISVFPNSGHAFASVDRESYRPAAAEAAWREALVFLRETLAPAGAQHQERKVRT
jgi:carboxymethylenebutenolidase